MENMEVGFLPWLIKIAERCTLVNLSLKDGKDNGISENDYHILEVLHGIWYDGEIAFQIHQCKNNGTDKTITKSDKLVTKGQKKVTA